MIVEDDFHQQVRPIRSIFDKTSRKIFPYATYMIVEDDFHQQIRPIRSNFDKTSLLIKYMSKKYRSAMFAENKKTAGTLHDIAQGL